MGQVVKAEVVFMAKRVLAAKMKDGKRTDADALAIQRAKRDLNNAKEEVRRGSPR